MKIKTSIILAVLFFAAGCSNDPIGQIDTNSGTINFNKKSDSYSLKDVYDSSAAAGTLFRVYFEGHIYIIRNWAGEPAGICHDPDCFCTKKPKLEKE